MGRYLVILYAKTKEGLNIQVKESPTSSKKSEGKVTNEDLQATMMQVIRSMEKISLETMGEVNRLCSLTRTLQRKLELEYSPPEEEAKEPTTPPPPTRKKNEQTRTSHQEEIRKEPQESCLPNLLPPPLEKTLPIQPEGTSTKSLLEDGRKPSPYQPPSLVNKGENKLVGGRTMQQEMFSRA
ncbi:S2-RNase [Pyrus ussuriensis x Pyrus communis]|uniref:S2-RNase n=1 Tax=Pyrus ussuriensis x Pyrus communis TaxID=2448454 RepID=A0A5N5H7R0_9ROSA|nr:S2-RNase [Pyrus ussuriensis x Pyrus communis]